MVSSARVRQRAVRAGLATVALIATATTGLVGGAGPSSAATGATTCRKVIAAAGDMNHLTEAKQTGALAQAQNPNMVTTLGDHYYPAATLAAFRNVYDKTPWGQLKPRDHPIPGHHEYDDPGAKGYFTYFGKPAYYAYDIGCGWRGYALNSLIDVPTQAAWLRRDLAAHPGVEVVATWSDPRFSSGTHHGNEPAMQPFFDALAGRKGVVLSGHEHNYERFAPKGQLREFVVGTAGTASYPFGTPQPGSQVRITGVPGVLVLVVQSGGRYSWKFKDRSGTAKDSGLA